MLPRGFWIDGLVDLKVFTLLENKVLYGAEHFRVDIYSSVSMTYFLFSEEDLRCRIEV